MESTTPDIAGLRKVVEAVENVPEEQFKMGLKFGSSKDAIGHFCRANPNDRLKLSFGWRLFLFPVPRLGHLRHGAAIAARFCITPTDEHSLFNACDYRFEGDESRIYRVEVIARIEQFIKRQQGRRKKETRTESWTESDVW